MPADPKFSISRGELLQLRDVVQAHCGIRLEEAKLGAIEDRLGGLAAAFGHEGLFAFNLRLMRELTQPHSAAWEALLPLVTINETYFFRERAQLDVLRDVVVPELLAGGLRRRLRVLSAPCSSGEEPYSIAMLLDEIPAALAGREVEIWGVDIDPLVIERARIGHYPHSAFRTTDARYVKRYFQALPNGYQASAELLKRVRFRRGNLLEMGSWPGFNGFDIILCRNMLIYFDKPTQARLVETFRRSLTPGGALLLGHSESLSGMPVALECRASARAVYYQRPLEAPHG